MPFHPIKTEDYFVCVQSMMKLLEKRALHNSFSMEIWLNLGKKFNKFIK
jgi:hypothetical protein